MNATETAIYAGERALLIRGSVVITIMGVAAALIFATLYGSVRPRMRRMYRVHKRMAAQVAGLKAEHASLTEQNQSLVRQVHECEKAVFEAQQRVAELELEVRRQTRIREKTEDALIKYRREIGR